MPPPVPQPAGPTTTGIVGRLSSQLQSLWDAVPRPSSVAQEATLGWAPSLSLVMTGGLSIVAYADLRARLDQLWASELLWVGLLIILLPAVARLAAGRASRRETITLIAMLAVAMHVVKILHSPATFTFQDEFAHWRTTNDILESRHLFVENPLLPVTARYPGLELVTTLVVDLTGLSIFDAGFIVAGIANLVFVLGLYLFFEVAARSARIAGLATVVYMTNPNFMFFTAQFKYETLALAFAAIAIYVIARRSRLASPDRRPWTILATVAVFASATTHHLTSYAVVCFLVLWVFLGIVRQAVRPGRAPYDMALIAYGINFGWLWFVAPGTVGYIAPVLLGAVTAGLQLVGARIGLLDGNVNVGRDLFANPAGLLLSPLWERYVALASVVVVLMGILWGGIRVLRRYRGDALTLALLVVTLPYPVLLLFRLSDRAWETSNRSAAMLYVGIGFVLAVGFVGIRRFTRSSWARPMFAVLAIGAMFIGGVFSGSEFSQRVPRPYNVGDGSRAIEAQGIQTAYWVRDHLGRGNRIGADQTNLLLLGSLGEQQVMSTISGGIDPLWVIYSPVFDQDKVDLLRSGRVKYLVVDRRLEARPELFEPYFANPQPDEALSKFDKMPGLSRIFDSGDIAIYDVRTLSGVR